MTDVQPGREPPIETLPSSAQETARVDESGDKDKQSDSLHRHLEQLSTAASRMGLVLGRLADERTYLTYQKEFEESELVGEARRVLDIIDIKSQSLLTYISISFAALIFLLAALPSSANLHLVALGRAATTCILLAIIFALAVAIVLSLSCLNMVGAHTIGKLKQQQSFEPKDYEELIIRVTCYRRNRYLVAHRISMATATFTGLLFLDLLIASIINAIR